jgi:hypothetical protein
MSNDFSFFAHFLLSFHSENLIDGMAQAFSYALISLSFLWLISQAIPTIYISWELRLNRTLCGNEKCQWYEWCIGVIG